MAQMIRVAPEGEKSHVSRRNYQNPPVHEVILDVQFQRGLDENTLRELRGQLINAYPEVDQLNLMQMEVSVGPPSYENVVRHFGGWQFKRDKTWIVQTSRTSLTLHFVRSELWPIGPYVGWSAIYEQYLHVHSALEGVYGSLEPKRAGVRYLNRIAIPKSEDVSEWMEFKLQAPKFLHDLYTFNLRQTWARAGNHEDMSATVGLVKIEIGDPALAVQNQGVLLDIDVFNLWIEKAPRYENLPAWFTRAHEVENEIFEGCMTKELRARFNQ